MKPGIKVAFASGTDELNVKLVDEMLRILPELPLYLVSEFPSADLNGIRWLPYHPGHSFWENWKRCRAAFRGSAVRLAAVMLVPGVPHRRMRLIAFLLSPARFLAFNENLNHFMLRPRSVPSILRHGVWRLKNYLRWQAGPSGTWHKLWYRVSHPTQWRIPYLHATARAAAALRPTRILHHALAPVPSSSGISVVIPSRDGRDLLEAQLPGIIAELASLVGEVIVVDNGSSDGTAQWLAERYPGIRCEVSAQPLSFARAVNRGIAQARYSHVCLLNNDMLLRGGFFGALSQAFVKVPDLFCATAEIQFPEGVRREETGKTVMRQPQPDDFPVRCEEPIAGEDLSYVLYGSGGCSLYDAAKLRELGGVDEAFEPAYVEDLDLGYRAWQRGWPSVYVAGAVVEHRHRATTSRYFSSEQIEAIVETNYLRFLARAVSDPKQFRRLWDQAIDRLRLLAERAAAQEQTQSVPLEALRRAARVAWTGGPSAVPAGTEDHFLALTSGAVAVFPEKPPTGKPRILIASPYLPFPLSHGGAVRMYNLMSRAAEEFDQILVVFADRLEKPPSQLTEIFAEIVLVQRIGSHLLPATGRPEVVEEFASAPFRAALRQTVQKWRPGVIQLEYTQMAQYAEDCRPSRVVLVEHDITFDLFEQLTKVCPDWETERQLARWRSFETSAWRRVDSVITMSEKDRHMISGAPAVALPNGVDLDRFQPSGTKPEPRILFVGSFAHLPNLLALDFFLRKAWPLLSGVNLHIIAGAKPEFYMRRYQSKISINLEQPGIEMDGFVEDVRPAYARAAVVIAPLVISAGTNIKILEAMAMGKAVVTTPAGINGLELSPGVDVLLAESPREMAIAIERMINHPDERRHIELAARRTVEERFGWNKIASRQAELYWNIAKEFGAASP
ncbi:MAG TPA: glycosyltransferase [Bryobacteraceae bacterium]|nr:glycosyltransferase [Bryobacteraceae bacterium]